MLEDDTCYFLVFDFDDKKDENHIKEDLLAFAKICDDFNIPMVIERSRSGKGFHCWIFFKEKIKAITARKFGILLLSKTMEIRDNLKIDSGYYVSTLGLNEATIRKYIREQEKEDMMQDKLTKKEYSNPFKVY